MPRADGLPSPQQIGDFYLARLLDETRAFHVEALSLLRGEKRPEPDLRTADDMKINEPKQLPDGEKLNEPAPPAGDGEQFQEFVPGEKDGKGNMKLTPVKKGEKAQKAK